MKQENNENKELEKDDLISSPAEEENKVVLYENNEIEQVENGENLPEENAEAQDKRSIAVRKLSAQEDAVSKTNAFDMFFIKVWAFIVAIVNGTANGINWCIGKIFKKKAPVRYVRAFVATVLIILTVVIVTLPFKIDVTTEKDIEIYGDGLLPVRELVYFDDDGYPVYKWGYINKSGDKVINAIYEEALPFVHKVAWVHVKEKRTSGEGIDDYWQLIDTKGKVKGKPAWKFYTSNELEGERPVGLFSEDCNLAWVYNAGKYGFINTSGNMAIEFMYNYAESFSYGVARVRSGNYEHYIDVRGNQVGSNFEQVETFSGGYGAVKRNGLWGFVDTRGNMIIQPAFDDVSSFIGGIALVRRGAVFGIINNKGDYIITPGQYYEIYGKSPELQEIMDELLDSMLGK